MLPIVKEGFNIKIYQFALSLIFVLLLALPVGASPSNESDASILFSPGSISLEQAPTIRFGSQKIAGKTTNYPAYGTRSGAVVIDARGNMSGWTLKANLSTFEQDGKTALPGTSLLFLPIAPQPMDSAGTVPTGLPSSVELIAGDNINHSLLWAKKGEGSGKWNVAFSAGNVFLHIPGGSAKPGLYQATIHWTLVDGPDS